MTIPLIVLAVFAVGIGFVVGPTHLFAGFVERIFPPAWLEKPPGMELGLRAISAVVAIGGILLAWLCYVVKPELPKTLAKMMRDLYQMSLNKFYLDELYDLFIVKPMAGLATFCRLLDTYVVDNLVDLIGNIPRLIGARFRPVQNGLLQFYALAMVLGLAVFLLALVSRP